MRYTTLILIAFIITACNTGTDITTNTGTITITATHDCTINIFDSAENHIMRTDYQADNQPFIFYPKTSDSFTITATNNSTTLTATLHFAGKHIQHYFEF